jgi:hypothetical protein
VDKQVEVLVGIAVAALVAVLALVAYRRGRRRRALRVEASARKYLSHQYGALPQNLTVHCSDDTLWPVLVAFDHPTTGVRHRLQFGVCERDASLSLRSETADNP